VKNTINYIIPFLEKVIFSQKNKIYFMKKQENANTMLTWKLVWDADTKDVLFLNKSGEFETVNELFETKNQNDLYDKIKELGLKYDPTILDFEWE